ncbi:hypothetical protein F5Y18DRAFT_436604 [Xylariaceae sp. FL1019]|nr:hypothetical protein F5Y18DRAFT_436604 [Xylariaceae sp. FL1019]
MAFDLRASGSAEPIDMDHCIAELKDKHKQLILNYVCKPINEYPAIAGQTADVKIQQKVTCTQGLGICSTSGRPRTHHEERVAKSGLVPYEATSVKRPARQVITKSDPQEYVPFTRFPYDQPQSPAWRGEQKRSKEKTRPASQFFTYEGEIPHNRAEELPFPQERRKVDAATAAVFQQLFHKSGVYGPLAWDKFSKALTSKGVDFTVQNGGGSAVTFIPPVGETKKSPITFHRPHGPQGQKISRNKQYQWAHRLSKKYQWDVGTFTAE